MGSALNNRRRILRRGLPYGGRIRPMASMALSCCATAASFSRQFEFVQQQWLNIGLDFNAGNDSCPLVGNHPDGARFVIAADPGSGARPSSPTAPTVRLDPRRRLFLRAQHDRAAHDRHGRGRPDMSLFLSRLWSAVIEDWAMFVRSGRKGRVRTG